VKSKFYMETTKISVEKTVSEIQMVLGRSGCSGVMTLFDENKVVSAVAFKILFLDREVAFKLPCRWENIYNHLLSKTKRRRRGKESDLLTQSKMIAWRQILRWVEAQLALVDCGMVKVFEVFLPYAQGGPKGQTVFERIEDSKGRFLIGHINNGGA
jgi:hypothetical protein